MQEKPAPIMGSHGAELTVTVTNELNGRQAAFQAGPGTPVSTVVQRMYESPALGIAGQSKEDRLQCKGGDDVFQHVNLHLGDYKDRYCGSLQWVFSGPTGGA